MSKRRKRRAAGVMVLVVLAAALVAGVVGGTAAFNVRRLNQRNDLQSQNSSVSINETFPDRTAAPNSTKTKRVAFGNTGTAPAFVRMAYSENWETDDALLTGSTGVTKNWTSAFGSDWELKSDGWYYYKKVLPAGATTEEILSSVTFPSEIPENADYKLLFQVETVQVSDEASVNTSATQTLFGRVGTVTNASVENGAVVSGGVSWS